MLNQTPFFALFFVTLLCALSSTIALFVSSSAGVGSDEVSRSIEVSVNHQHLVPGSRLHVLDNRVDQQPAPPSATLLPAQQQVPRPVKVRQCEPIRIDLCAGLGYNVTGFPNLAGHDSASDAEQQLRTFGPLIKYECSSNGELRLFLCAVYVPMCTEQFPDVIGPCRSVCERVRSRCEPVLQHFGFPWPPALRCDRFHARNNVDDHMCMEGPEVADDVIDVDAPWPSSNTKPKTGSPKKATTPICGGGNANGPGCKVAGTSSDCVETNTTASSSSSSLELIRAWTAVWSVSATLSALFVVITFAVDSSRYTYLDRVVLLTASCSAVCAVAHLSRLSLGQTGSSVDPGTVDRQPPCSLSPMTSTPSLSRGEPGGDCTVAFVVVYYFSSASSMWWLVLTIVLTLVTLEKGFSGNGVQWTDAEIRRRLSTWFHLAAWGAPALATIVLLVRKEIAVDMTSSVVGSRAVCRIIAGSSSGLGMELVPLSICTFVGLTFLLISFVRHRQSRAHVSHYACKDDRNLDNKETELLRTGVNHRKLTSSTQQAEDSATSGCDCACNSIVARIGIIAVVGFIALIATVSCLIYDYIRPQSASIATLLVRITSSVLIASVVGPWLIISGQAVISWNSFVVRRRQRKAPRTHQHQQQQQQPHFTNCKDCISVETSSRCRHHNSSSCRPLSDSVSEANKWIQLPVDHVAPVHGKTWRARSGHVGTATKNKMAPGDAAYSSRNSLHVCDSTCRDASLDIVRGYYQSNVAGLPPPPPPSQYTSLAAVNAQAWSARNGLELGSCKCCYRQHSVQKYVI